MQVSSLTRAWQILLKGLFEVRDAVRPISACEMALIRLAYAAELPPTDRLVKDLMDGNGAAPRAAMPAGTAAPARAPVASSRAPALNMAPMPAGESAPTLRGLEDIAPAGTEEQCARC